MSRRADPAPAKGAHEAATLRLAPGAATALALGTVVLAAAFAHRAALGAFFTTDDLILFERVRGIVPWPWTLWRIVSGRLWWLATFPSFGTNPLPWHVANVVLHAANAALVAAWARRLGLATPAALLAGGLFGASATAMTVTWSATAIGELLACAFALAGLLVFSRERPRAPLAWAAFAVALLCKEHVALVPLAALAAAPSGTRTARLRVIAPALAAGALLWTWILLARDATGSLQGEAYAFGAGSHVLANLRDYAAWALDRGGQLAPTGVGGAAPGWLGVAALAALAFASWWSPAAAAGLALFALALLPVLPLSHHTYVHYLYLPFAGWCVSLAAALEGVAGRWRDRLEAWAVAVILVFFAALAGAGAITRTASTLTRDGQLPADSFVRRMSVARHAWESIGRELPAGTRRLVIVRPAESRRALSARTGEAAGAITPSAPAYDLASGALDGGRGLRALFPQLAEVRFADVLAPGDSAATIATATVDGRVGLFGRGPEGVVPIADLWMRGRFATSTRDLLVSALAIWPRDPELTWRRDSLDASARRVRR